LAVIRFSYFNHKTVIIKWKSTIGDRELNKPITKATESSLCYCVIGSFFVGTDQVTGTFVSTGGINWTLAKGLNTVSDWLQSSLFCYL
jgi:hypothetical protein